MSPTCATVTKATLQMYGCDYLNRHFSEKFPGTTKTVYRVRGAWSQSTLNNNNAPALGTAVGTSTIVEPGWESVDITSLVREWVRTPSSNNGVAFKLNRDYQEHGYYSSENGPTANRPKLTVTYDGGTGTADAPAHAIPASRVIGQARVYDTRGRLRQADALPAGVYRAVQSGAVRSVISCR